MQTLHLAVLIMDLFLATKDDSEISDEQYKLCSVTCLLIAAKSFELDDLVPKSAKLQQIIQYPGEHFKVENGCSSPLITDCERQVLNSLSWDFETYPTFYSIVSMFRAQGILFNTDNMATTPHNDSLIVLVPIQPNLVILVDKYLDLFCLLALGDPAFVGANPYILACAILAAGRRASGVVSSEVDKSWPTELWQLTGLQSSHFLHITDLLISKY